MLFYKNYIVYYNVYCIIVVCSLESMYIPSFVLIGCCVSELYGHIYPYRNVWPEAVYCCSTTTTSFTIIYLYDQLEVAITSPSVVTLYLMVSEIAKYIA